MSQGSNKIHIMVDIETYDTKPTAVILSIGACVITGVLQSYYRELDPTTQTYRTVSDSTKEWWSKQPMPIPIGPYSLYAALTDFSWWLQDICKGAEPVIWCKGTDFDVAILANAYEQMYLPIPWKYNNIRDCRTVFKIAEWQATKASHNALDDAKAQVVDLQCALNKLNGVLA